MTEEMDDLRKKYHEETGVRLELTTTVDLSLGWDSWGEEAEDFDSCLAFAKWYAKHLKRHPLPLESEE